MTEISTKTTARKFLQMSILSLATVLSVIFISSRPGTYGSLGTRDFIQYWSAYRLMQNGENPYDPVALLRVEKEAGLQGDLPLMMWNPPWLISLMAPVLSFDFESSARVWALTSLILAFISLIIVMKAAGEGPMFPGLLAGLAWVPLWISLSLGQSSILLLFGSSLLYFGLVRSNSFAIGTALVFLSIKPHLFHLLALTLIWWTLRERRLKQMSIAGLWAAGILSLCALQFPAALTLWFQTLSPALDAPLASPRLQWLCATLPGIIRVSLVKYFNIDTVLPTYIVPWLAEVSLLIYLLIARPVWRWSTHFFPLLALSYLTAPYGWVFDQSILAGYQALLVMFALRSSVPKTRACILSSLALLNLAALVYWQAIGQFQHEMWWPALGIAFGAVYCRKHIPVYGASSGAQ